MNIPQGLVYEFRIHLSYSVVRYDEIVNLKLKKGRIRGNNSRCAAHFKQNLHKVEV